MSEISNEQSLRERVVGWLDRQAAQVKIHADDIPPHHEVQALNSLRRKKPAGRHPQPPKK